MVKNWNTSKKFCLLEYVSCRREMLTEREIFTRLHKLHFAIHGDFSKILNTNILKFGLVRPVDLNTLW
jgi:hypothetical protein